MDHSTWELAYYELEKYGIKADLIIDHALTAFEFRHSSGNLIIAAPNTIELLYGVYDFAERFGGYSFFEPGNDRFDPARKVNDLPEGILFTAPAPLLKRRGFIQEFPFDDETGQLFDWMAKNKLNYLLVWMKYYDDLPDQLKDSARIRALRSKAATTTSTTGYPVNSTAKVTRTFSPK